MSPFKIFGGVSMEGAKEGEERGWSWLTGSPGHLQEASGWWARG